MKTLTYGKLPTFEEFERAFYTTVPYTTDGKVLYTANLNSTDYHKLGALCLDARGEFMGKGLTWDFAYTARELYDLCQSLTELNTPVGITRHGVSAVEWAMDFASSILFTLGFEWV